jgi:hypothetical protein
MIVLGNDEIRKIQAARPEFSLGNEVKFDNRANALAERIQECHNFLCIPTIPAAALTTSSVI